jgi:hypothetical protein
MLATMEIQPSTFVLKFFRTPAGELYCRATDTKTMENWTIVRGDALWQLLGAARATSSKWSRE